MKIYEFVGELEIVLIIKEAKIKELLWLQSCGLITLKINLVNFSADESRDFGFINPIPLSTLHNHSKLKQYKIRQVGRQTKKLMVVLAKSLEGVSRMHK